MTPTIGQIVLYTSGLDATFPSPVIGQFPIDPATGQPFAASAINPATGQRFDAGPSPSAINPATGARFDASFPATGVGPNPIDPRTGVPFPPAAVNPATGLRFDGSAPNPSSPAPFAGPPIPPTRDVATKVDASPAAVRGARVARSTSPAPTVPAAGQFPNGPFPVNPATGQPFREQDINPATNQRFDAAGPFNAGIPSSALDPVTGKPFVGAVPFNAGLPLPSVNVNPATGKPFSGSDVNPATGQRFDVGVPNPIVNPPFTGGRNVFTPPPEVAPAIITAVNQDGTVALHVFYRDRTVDMASVEHALIPGAPNGPGPSGEWQPAAGSPGAAGMWQWPPK